MNETMDVARQLAYEWLGLNHQLFLLVHGSSSLPARALAHAGAWLGTLRMLCVVLAGFAIALYVAHRKGERLAIQRTLRLTMTFIVASALLGCLAVGLQQALALPRPHQLFPDQVSLLGTLHFTAGFPSAPAGYAVLLAVLCWPLLGRAARWAAAAGVLLVAVSRVLAGASFPADVVAGGLLGYACVLAARAGLAWAERAANGDPPQAARADATTAAAAPGLPAGDSGRRSA